MLYLPLEATNDRPPLTLPYLFSSLSLGGGPGRLRFEPISEGFSVGFPNKVGPVPFLIQRYLSWLALPNALVLRQLQPTGCTVEKA